MPYAVLDLVISCKNELDQLGAHLPSFDLDVTAQFYAQDVQDALHIVMRRHAEDVGFEVQIAILGVAIGAILHQLPKSEKVRFTKLLLRNVNDAPKLSQVIRMQ